MISLERAVFECKTYQEKILQLDFDENEQQRIWLELGAYSAYLFMLATFEVKKEVSLKTHTEALKEAKEVLERHGLTIKWEQEEPE